jgi:cytidine deaminase
VTDPAPGQTVELTPEDAKLVTLARSGRPRAVTVDAVAEGAAVRDDTGRTYLAATVEKSPLALSALHLAVASALASGARGFEAAAVVTEADEPAGTDVLDAVGIAQLIVARPDGSVVRG